MGWCLVILGGAAALFWHYWLVPFKRSVDYEWQTQRTPKGWWPEVERKIKRFGLDHASSIYVGHYGDERWMEWVVKALDPNLPAGNCGQGQMHLPEAPYYISNQEPPGDSDWKIWWSTNKNKSQFEWVRDGFKQSGLDLDAGPTTNNILSLLKIIGRGQPWYQEYNAKRWLRDIINLEPVNFDPDTTAPEDRVQVGKGLIEFAVWLGENRHSPGVLSEASLSQDDDWIENSKPEILKAPTSVILNLTPFVLMALGWGFLRKAKAERGRCQNTTAEPISLPVPRNF